MKVTEHDKLLKKFMHKKALLAVLNWKNLKNVVVVMEELVARKKLLRCVSNLEIEELGLLLKFLQRYSTLCFASSSCCGGHDGNYTNFGFYCANNRNNYSCHYMRPLPMEYIPYPFVM
ncbi:hypothetical protein FXO37_21462 [Capsicum annuum]|nr:hypothetical protein FXO37_21462 [Capsicum annuum]